MKLTYKGYSYDWDQVIGIIKFIVRLLTRGLDHERSKAKKGQDNEQRGEWLQGMSNEKAEQSLQIKPKNGSEIRYKKGPDNEVEGAEGKKGPAEVKPESKEEINGSEKVKGVTEESRSEGTDSEGSDGPGPRESSD